jgi:hypothetical protein
MDGSIITVRGYVIKEGKHIFILSTKNKWEKNAGVEFAFIHANKELENEWDEKFQSDNYYLITGEYFKSCSRFGNNSPISKYDVGSIRFNAYSMVDPPAFNDADVNSKTIPLVRVVSKPALRDWVYTVTFKFLLDHGWLIKVIYVVFILLILLSLVTTCICFSKANLPWWGGLIPIYNLILFLEMAKMSKWWFIPLLFPIFLRLNGAFHLVDIPPVNYLIRIAIALFFLILGIVIGVRLARAFNKGVLFAIGLMILPVIFIPILAFGSSKYNFD